MVGCRSGGCHRLLNLRREQAVVMPTLSMLFVIAALSTAAGFRLSHAYRMARLRKVCRVQGHVWDRDCIGDIYCTRCFHEPGDLSWAQLDKD